MPRHKFGQHLRWEGVSLSRLRSAIPADRFCRAEFLPILVLAAIIVRIVIVFFSPWHGTTDLENYFWPAQQVLEGRNPYELWAEGASGERRSDITPLELLLFVPVVALWEDSKAIQLLFVAADAGVLLLGITLFTTRQARLGFTAFYGFSPLAE
jgi:hypothetical protein